MAYPLLDTRKVSLSLLPPSVFSLVLLVRQKGEKNVSPVASLPHSLSKDSPAQHARSPGCCLLLGAYSLLAVISYDINSLDRKAEMACLKGVWLQHFWPFTANSLIRSWSQC